MPVQKIVKEHEQSMQKAYDHLVHEYKGVRTGRASTGLVDNLHVEYYGNMTPINQLASVSTPDAITIMIKPYDASSLKDIEKAIKEANIGMNPNSDGKAIRLNVPPLSEERRKEIVAQIKQMGEQAKVAIRNIRRDANKKLDDEEKAKAIAEDARDKGKKDVEEITKTFTSKIEETVKHKTEEIMNS